MDARRESTIPALPVWADGDPARRRVLVDSRRAGIAPEEMRQSVHATSVGAIWRDGTHYQEEVIEAMPSDPLRSTVAVEMVLAFALACDRLLEDADPLVRGEYRAHRQAALDAAQVADGAVRGALSLLRSGRYTPGLLRHWGDILPPLPEEAA